VSVGTSGTWSDPKVRYRRRLRPAKSTRTAWPSHSLLRHLTADTSAAMSPALAAVQEWRGEIIQLSFLAASDGDFADSELDAIVKHVLDAVPDEEVTEHEVRAKVKAFVPDEGDQLPMSTGFPIGFAIAANCENAGNFSPQIQCRPCQQDWESVTRLRKGCVSRCGSLSSTSQRARADKT